MRLSLLDVVPVRTGQNTAQSLSVAIETAQYADQAGFHRYWLAEHHNSVAVGSTSPGVLAGILASKTERIKLGAGGVMLPNHSPFVIAEQFALLEAAFPGRIDLGLGRAPGSDPVITALLNRSGTTTDPGAFPRAVEELRMMLEPGGSVLQLGDGREYHLAATPEAVGRPGFWVLGSSESSAQLAAAEGLPYVFANHFGFAPPTAALARYRSEFKPSETLEAPNAFVTAAAVAADTAEEAEARALPQILQMAQRRLGGPQEKAFSVEEAAQVTPSPDLAAMMAQIRRSWIVGTGDQVAAGIRDLAETHQVEEIMLSTWVSEDEGTDPETAPARLRSFELIAERLLG